MGTISFLLVVAGLISGIYALLRRINSQSYRRTSRNTAQKQRKAFARKQREELPISSWERKYVDWYLENGHKRQDAKPVGPVSQPSSIVGVAFLTNESEPQRHVSNG